MTVLFGETRHAPISNGTQTAWETALRIQAPPTFSDYNAAIGRGATMEPITSRSATDPAFDPTTTFMAAIAVTMFSSNHPGGSHFATAGGSTKLVSESIEITICRDLGRRMKPFPIGGIE